MDALQQPLLRCYVMGRAGSLISVMLLCDSGFNPSIYEVETESVVHEGYYSYLKVDILDRSEHDLEAFLPTIDDISTLWVPIKQVHTLASIRQRGRFIDQAAAAIVLVSAFWVLLAPYLAEDISGHLTLSGTFLLLLTPCVALLFSRFHKERFKNSLLPG